MKRLLLYIWLVASVTFSYGQTFSSAASGTIPAFVFGTLANSVTASGLGNLDGINLGVTSLEINIKGSAQPLASIEMYLVAPSGHAVYLMNQGSNFDANTNQFIFTINPSDPQFLNWPTTISPINSYQPRGNLNSFNIGINPNGTWKLHATQKNFFASAVVISWKINFGTSGIVKGSPNQSCASVLPLINTTTTGNWAFGTNKYHGIVLADSKATDVGSSGYTESSIWYSFVPKCKNDKIEIVSDSGNIQSGILSGTCASRIRIASSGIFINSTYTYNVTTFVPGNTYYLAMDGTQAEFFNYDVKWYEGTDCPTNTPTITTSATPKTTFCTSESFSIPFTSTGAFTAGNTFTAELSDASGSFASPTTIGNVVSVSATSITVALPATASGNGYKIRVKASNPATIGTESAAFRINNVPTNPSTITGELSVCANVRDQKYSVGLVQDATKYRWKFTSGSIVATNSDSSSIAVDFGTLNSTISVQAVNACGASGIMQKQITIKPNVTPLVSIAADNTTICQGDSVTFTASVDFGGANPSFQWRINQTDKRNNSNVFKTVSLKKMDSVSVIVTNTETCVTPPPAISNKIGLVVKDTIKPEISLLGSTDFCQGSEIKFTASTKNKGTLPVFEWRVNKILQTATDSIFSSATLKDKDTIRVQLISNGQCARPNVVNAALFPLKVVSSILPKVTIKGDSVACVGTLMNFKAEFFGGGTNPTFVWKVNGQEAGTTANFSKSDFRNSNKLTVEMTSVDACANPKSVISKDVTISIQDKRTPNINLLITQTGICTGDSFTFQANTAFGGNLVWKVNQNNMNNNSFIFSSKSLKKGDSVNVELTSTEACLVSTKAFDFKIVELKDTVKPEISISGDLSICDQNVATYTAMTQKMGTNPIFKWFVNETQSAENRNVVNISGLQNQDKIWVTLESSDMCARPKVVTSNTIQISVNSILKYQVTLTNPTAICAGDSLFLQPKLNITPASNAVYQWHVNGKRLANNLFPDFKGKFKNADSVYLNFYPRQNCAVPTSFRSNTIKIQVNDTVRPSISMSSDSVFCKNETIHVLLNASQTGLNPNFAWEVDNQLSNGVSAVNRFANLAAGAHTIKASMKSDAVCARPILVSAQKTITVLDSIRVAIVISGDVSICAGSDAFFQLNNNPNLKGKTYHWLVNGRKQSDATRFQSNTLVDGDQVELELRATEKCIASNTVLSNRLKLKVIESVTPEITLRLSKSSICPDEEITISSQIVDGNASQTFEWLKNGTVLENETNEKILIKFTKNDSILLHYATDLACGSFSKIVSIPAISFKEAAPILSTIQSPNEYCAQDAEIGFKTDLLPNVSYSWQYPRYAQAIVEGNAIRLNLEGNAATDTLKVSASNECGTSDTLRVVLKPKNCSKLVIPNAIITSASNGNELWLIQGIELYPNAKVAVFNRWGTNVFQSKGYNQPFDGTFAGKALPAGTYYYVIENVNQAQIVGDLTIVH